MLCTSWGSSPDAASCRGTGIRARCGMQVYSLPRAPASGDDDLALHLRVQRAGIVIRAGCLERRTIALVGIEHGRGLELVLRAHDQVWLLLSSKPRAVICF